MMRQWLLGHAARLRSDIRGVAAVEFAFTVPILLLLYLGGFELSQAMATYRKVSDTTVELANVSAQYTTMSASVDVPSIFSASSQIMTPFSTGNLTIVMSEVYTDPTTNVATVQWSYPYQGGTPLPAGQVIALPAGMAQPGLCYILVQATYLYNPVVGAAFIGSIPMTDQIFMQPRSSACIAQTA
jgi:Flp pilus assembly protein TadG